MEEAYPVLRRDYPLNERNLGWWANEKESPYTEVKRFDWYRGYHVGGRSLLWGRQSYRWSDFDFEANAREGIAIDWPIRYAELSPWYDHVERHAGIAGSIESMPQLPDGQFQPAMPLNCGEELVAGRVRGLFDGRRRIIPGRVANLTQPLPGRAPCQYRNACWLGCPYGAYFSTQSSTLPAAMALVQRMPWYAFAFMVFTMANVGLPGTSGFVGEFLTLIGAFQANTWVAVLATTGVILSACYALWLYQRVIFGVIEKPGLAAMMDLSLREKVILVPLIALAILFGVYPAPIMEVTAASVDQLIHNYQAALDGGAAFAAR
jgi:choline dehydrogenase-like flavoprotein